MIEQELEYCYLCGEPTGRAGKDDDSIYVELTRNFLEYTEGDEIGGLCIDCYEALRQLGLVKESPLAKKPN